MIFRTRNWLLDRVYQREKKCGKCAISPSSICPVIRPIYETESAAQKLWHEVDCVIMLYVVLRDSILVDEPLSVEKEIIP